MIKRILPGKRIGLRNRYFRRLPHPFSEAMPSHLILVSRQVDRQMHREVRCQASICQASIYSDCPSDCLRGNSANHHPGSARLYAKERAPAERPGMLRQA